jgi:hypothetical protein
MNEMRIERALRGGPPFATPYQPMQLDLERTDVTRIRKRRMVVVVALLVLVATVGGLLVVSGMFDSVRRLAACPAAHDESEARDTFVPGLSSAQRAWHHTTDSPTGLRPGPIAVFEYGLPDAELAVVAIDPATGQRCRLLTFETGYQVAGFQGNELDWSPTGDALAIGVFGQLFVWTPEALLRVWVGDRYPVVEWAPDGATLAVGNGYGGDGDAFAPNPGLHLIAADGSPDRAFPVDVDPGRSGGLRWSPDGTRLAVGTSDGAVGDSTRLSIVTALDGTTTSLDLGIVRVFSILGWTDNEHVLVRSSVYIDPDQTQYLVVPIDSPTEFTPLPVPTPPDEVVVFAPAFDRIAYVVGEDGVLGIAGIGGSSVRIDAPGLVSTTLAWTADGSALAYQTQEPLGIVVINADASSPRRIAAGNVLLMRESDAWQPVPR